MTMIYTYLAVNQDKRVVEVDYARVVPNDQIFTRMINEGAERVLTWGTDVPAWDWRNEDRNTELVVSQNVALMHFCDTGHLDPVERPAIALLEKKSGNWGCTCTTCNRIVCKPMKPQHIPLLIVSGEQHLRISH